MAKLYNSKDKNLNPQLAGEVAEVRGGIVGAAEKFPLPSRFDAVPHPDRPSMVITDIETGKAAIVPLFAYGSVRQALADLFS